MTTKYPEETTEEWIERGKREDLAYERRDLDLGEKCLDCLTLPCACEDEECRDLESRLQVALRRPL